MRCVQSLKVWNFSCSFFHFFILFLYFDYGIDSKLSINEMPIPDSSLRFL